MADDELHMTLLGEERLAELANKWREQALQGARGAYGAAAAFEGELRRRRDDGDAVDLNLVELPCARPWWKVW